MVCRLNAGRGSVVLSVGAESTEVAARHAARAASAGASAVMAIPPLSVMPGEPELLGYYERIVKEAAVPLIVQDASGYVGRGMSLEFQVAIWREFGENEAVAAELSARYVCLDHEDGFLSEGPDLRHELIDTLRLLQPDVVFTHWRQDYNDDHVVTSKAVTDAALFVSIPSFLSQHPALPRPPAIFYVDPGRGYGFEGTHFVESTKRP